MPRGVNDTSSANSVKISHNQAYDSERKNDHYLTFARVTGKCQPLPGSWICGSKIETL